MTKAVIVKIDPRDPDLARIREVAKASREGKIVAFPTETVYGIGGPMNVPGLGERLAELKGREAGKHFSFHIGEWEMVDYLQVKRTPSFRYLARMFWPGPLTLVVKNIMGETVGIRFPKSLLSTALFNSSGAPFVATSANLSGQPSPRTADQVIDALGDKIDYVIDGGECEIGEDSSVVDLSDEKNPEILRSGARAEEVKQAADKIRRGKFPRKKVLIVCTGNSCRSPMAEGWLREELAKHHLSDEIEVSSCGVGARNGMSATPEAAFVMKNREIDITEHRSQVCSREDVMNADLILAMGQQHYVFITGMVPQVKDKIKVLNVMDPIGMSMNVYEDVMNVIDKKMKDLWLEIVE